MKEKLYELIYREICCFNETQLLGMKTHEPPQYLGMKTHEPPHARLRMKVITITFVLKYLQKKKTPAWFDVNTAYTVFTRLLAAFACNPHEMVLKN